MKITDLNTTMEDISAALESSVRQMQDNFIQSVPVFDILSDYSVGDIIDPIEFDDVLSTFGPDAITFASQNIDPTLNYAVNLYAEGGAIYSRAFDEAGQIISSTKVVDEVGVVLSKLIDTQGHSVNVDSMYESIRTSEALLSASEILVNLQKEGTLNYANYQAALGSIPNLSALSDVEEFDYMLEAAKAGNVQIYLDLLRQFSTNVSEGLKGGKDKIQFEDASYTPLKFVPITLSNVVDFATSALSFIAAVFYPIALIPIGLFNGAKMMLSSAKELEQYRVEDNAINNRLSVPLHQYVVPTSEAPIDILEAVSLHGFIKVVHVGLEQFFWINDQYLYAEMFVRVEVSRDYNSVNGRELDLTWIPNNINTLSSYPPDFEVFNPVSGSKQINISRSIFTSVLIALRLVLPDGVKISGSKNTSKIFEAMEMFGPLANEGKDWTSVLLLSGGVFDEFRIIADKITEGTSIVNQHFDALGKDIELTGSASDHYVFDPIPKVDNPTYTQDGTFPVYQPGMLPDETIKLGTPTTVTTIWQDFTLDLNRVITGFWSSADNKAVPPSPFSSSSSGYYVDISNNHVSNWEGAYIRDATPSEIQKATTGLVKYKNHPTYSTDYINDMKRNGPDLVERHFKGIRAGEYNLMSTIPNARRDYFQFMIKYVVSGTAYWKVLSFYITKMKYYSVTGSSESYYKISAINAVGNLFLYKSFRDRQSLILNPVTKGEFKVFPPRVTSGSLIKTIGVVIFITTAVVVTTLALRRFHRASKLRRTVRRQEDYANTVDTFNSDPTNANFAKMERASRRLNRSYSRLGNQQQQHLSAISRMNNNGFSVISGGVTNSQTVLSGLTNRVFDEVVGTTGSISERINELETSVGEVKSSING